jgi:hypothetical protein
MKKLLLTISLVLLQNSIMIVNAQECLFGQIEPVLSDNPNISYASQNGWYVPASGTLRLLIVFGEINYVNGGDPTGSNGTTGWPAHSLPTWANDLTDVSKIPSGIYLIKLKTPYHTFINKLVVQH